MIIIKANIVTAASDGFELPALPYAKDANEPTIDAETMETHHGKHHAGYVDKLNDALEDHPDLQGKSIEDLLSDLDAIPEEIREAVKNNGGGHLNHSMFWPLLGGDGSKPTGDLMSLINDNFGSFEEMKDRVTAEGMNQFGNGWAWLALDDRDALLAMRTPNQDSLVSRGYRPIFGIDVWEHAYYLKHKNDREAYLDAIWDVINWGQVEENLRDA
jgi:Fe-Mn family superoxide dismutase